MTGVASAGPSPEQGGGPALAASRGSDTMVLPMGTLRLVVAEDNLLVREGLLSLLSTAGDIDVVGVCSSLPELLDAVDDHLPDVVTTDIRMPPDHSDEGIRAAAEIRERHPGMGVLVLSQFVDPAYALGLLEQGVSRRGYLLKDHLDDGDRLIEAILAVAAGGSFIDDEVVDALVRGRSRVADNPLEALSQREMEVLADLLLKTFPTSSQSTN